MCTAPLSKRFTSRPKTKFDEKLAAELQGNLPDCGQKDFKNELDDGDPFSKITCVPFEYA